MMTVFHFSFLLIFGFFASVQTQAAEAQSAPEQIQIQACNDESGWPPFSYRISGVNQGFSYKLLQEVFKGSPYQFKLSWMPWSRCLSEAENGNMDIAMDIYFSEERSRYLEYTKPFYQLSSSLYYWRARPGYKNIDSVEELKKKKVCGRRDFDYSHFQVKEKDFSILVSSYEQVFKLLTRERCDFFPEESEIIDALIFNRSLKIEEKDFGKMQPSWVKGPQIHWGISRKSSRKKELVEFINARLEVLLADRELIKRLKENTGLK